MKIPRTFLPGKDLEEKVTGLKACRKSKVKSLNSLVLWHDSEDFINCTELGYSCFKEEFPYLGTWSVCEKYIAKYDDVILWILEFMDKSSLEDNKKNIKKCLKKFGDKNICLQVNAVFKDKYVIFIETFLGDYDRGSKFINAYKKDFGFREFKQ